MNEKPFSSGVGSPPPPPPPRCRVSCWLLFCTGLVAFQVWSNFIAKEPHVPFCSETRLPSGATMSFRCLMRSPCQSHTWLAPSWVFPVLESARGLAVLCPWKLPHVSSMWNKEDGGGGWRGGVPQESVRAHMASPRDVGDYTAFPHPARKTTNKASRERING